MAYQSIKRCFRKPLLLKVMRSKSDRTGLLTIVFLPSKLTKLKAWFFPVIFSVTFIYDNFTKKGIKCR